jgi:hypothetical protein
VATRALKPEYAILLSATANFVGALVFGTAVAGTVGSKIVDDHLILANGSTVLMAALLGAIAWNLITWRLSIPSSSSHALIGGLIGGAWAAAGSGAVQWDQFAGKVLVPLFSSPILGLVIGFGLMIAILNLFVRANPRRMNDRFRKLQIVSATYMALAHGSNDAQKTMGIMTLALFTAKQIPDKTVPMGHPDRGNRHVPGHGGRRLADHEDDGPEGREAGSGPRLRRRDHGSLNHHGRFSLRHAGLHHARHLQRHHGRRLQRVDEGRQVGRGQKHRDGLGPDDPVLGLDRRGGYLILHA